MSLSLPSSYRTAFISGLSHGFILPFAGSIAASFISSSLTVVIAAGVLLSLLGAAVWMLAERWTRAEEWKETDPRAMQKDFDKEQRILARIGIPPQVLEPMQQEMNEEQSRRMHALPPSASPVRSYKDSLCHFLGYCTCGGFNAFFLYISDRHFVIAGTMLLGVKFAVELYKNTRMIKTAYPLIRTLLNITATAIIFAGTYALFRSVAA